MMAKKKAKDLKKSFAFGIHAFDRFTTFPSRDTS